MSRHYSANQYEGAFKSKQLQNWTLPKTKVEHRPKKYEGYSVFITNDSGYLMKDQYRSKESPWGSFIGTWDMPTKIPGNNILNSTARHPSSASSLKNMKTEFDQKLKNPKVPVSLSNETPTKQNEEVDDSNSAKVAPASKPQTPKSPFGEPQRYESPALNKVSIPTPLGLQEPDIATRAIKTPSQESEPPMANDKIQVGMVPGSKPSTPKSPLQDIVRTEEVLQPPVQSPTTPYEKRAVNCSPCPSKRSVGFAQLPSGTISWPAPKLE